MGAGVMGIEDIPPPVVRRVMRYYVLAADGRTPVPASSREAVACMPFERGVIGQTTLGVVTVSTVFTGYDCGDGLLWETVMLGSGLTLEQDQYEDHYATYDAAVAGHALACAVVFGWGKEGEAGQTMQPAARKDAKRAIDLKGGLGK